MIIIELFKKSLANDKKELIYKKNYTKELMVRKKLNDWIKEVEHIYEFLIEYEDGAGQKIDYTDEKIPLFAKAICYEIRPNNPDERIKHVLKE